MTKWRLEGRFFHGMNFATAYLCLFYGENIINKILFTFALISKGTEITSIKINILITTKTQYIGEKKKWEKKWEKSKQKKTTFNLSSKS